MNAYRWQVLAATIDWLLAAFYLVFFLTGHGWFYLAITACWLFSGTLMTRSAKRARRRLPPSERKTLRELQRRQRNVELAGQIMRQDDYLGTDYFHKIYSDRYDVPVRVTDYQTPKTRILAADIGACELELRLDVERFERARLRYEQPKRIEPPEGFATPSKKEWRKPTVGPKTPSGGSRAGNVAKQETVVCFMCGGAGAIHPAGRYVRLCDACSGSGTTRIVVEKRQKEDGFYPARKPTKPLRNFEPWETGDGTPEADKQERFEESVRALDEELERLSSKVRAEPVPIPFLDRNVEALCDCPKGHAGIHLLDSIESEPDHVLRTCTEENCGAQWRERA